MNVDFYDFDYIIQFNEKVADIYTKGYQEVQKQFTNILIIYSAISLYLIPILKESFALNSSFLLRLFFILFAVLFVISIINTIKLIYPATMSYPRFPSEYYNEMRQHYEQIVGIPVDDARVNNLLKASYISELETIIITNEEAFR